MSRSDSQSSEADAWDKSMTRMSTSLMSVSTSSTWDGLIYNRRQRRNTMIVTSTCRSQKSTRK
jgi:hypothetical protein